MEGVQHAVPDKPMRAGRVELRIGAVAIERAVELARQRPGHLQGRRVAFEGDRREIAPRGSCRRLLLHGTLPYPYLYTVKIWIGRMPGSVKQNLYSVKIATYKAGDEKNPPMRKTDHGKTPPRTRNPASRTAPGRPLRARHPRADEETPYHHGALRDALLQAAERVLEREGLAGLTLRAVAREAGVSHAAPTHHFGDLTGLVSELAAIGFRQFNAAMVAAGVAGGSAPMEKALARAKAYVAYAQAHPGMYGLK